MPPPPSPDNAASTATKINARFYTGKASSDLAEAGVVMHQFDHFEDKHERWVCPSNGEFAGRVSTFIAFRRMKARADRVAVPLIGMGGGVIIDPSIPIKCAYGDDGSTYKAPGGCYQSQCSRDHPWTNRWDGAPPCGFGNKGQVWAAWQPQDLDIMLSLYVEHSQRYRKPQFYSGYNEIIYGCNAWNSHLPTTIEAFFVIAGGWESQNRNGPTANLHRAFLQRYRLSEDNVPLLTFDPENWNRPFTVAPR